MKTTTEGYSSRQVCERTGLTYRQLDYWVRIGAIGPSISAADGYGSHRRFSDDDVRQIRVVVAVHGAVDVSRSSAHRTLLRRVAALAKVADGDRWLVLAGDDVAFCGTDDLVDRCKGGAVVVDLEAV